MGWLWSESAGSRRVVAEAARTGRDHHPAGTADGGGPTVPLDLWRGGIRIGPLPGRGTGGQRHHSQELAGHGVTGNPGGGPVR